MSQELTRADYQNRYLRGLGLAVVAVLLASYVGFAGEPLHLIPDSLESVVVLTSFILAAGAFLYARTNARRAHLAPHPNLA